MNSFLDDRSTSRMLKIISTEKQRVLTIIRMGLTVFQVKIEPGSESERKFFFPGIFMCMDSKEVGVKKKGKRFGSSVRKTREKNIKRVGEVSKFLKMMDGTYNASSIAKRNRIKHNMEKRKIIHDSRINIEGGNLKQLKKTSFQRRVYQENLNKLGHEWKTFEKSLQFNDSMKKIFRISSPQIDRKKGISLTQQEPQYFRTPPSETDLNIMRGDIKRIRKLMDTKSRVRPWIKRKKQVHTIPTRSKKKKKKKQNGGKRKNVRKKKRRKKGEQRGNGLLDPPYIVKPLLVSFENGMSRSRY